MSEFKIPALACMRPSLQGYLEESIAILTWPLQHGKTQIGGHGEWGGEALEYAISNTGCSNKQMSFLEGAPSSPPPCTLVRAPRLKNLTAACYPTSLCQKPSVAPIEPILFISLDLQRVQTHYRPC